MAAATAKYVLTADDRTGQAFDSVKAKFRDTARTATRVGAGIAAAGAAGFAAMAREAINGADEIGKLSRQIGVSTENLSEMRGVVDLVGGSFEGYTKSLTRMQRSVTDLADGSASMTESFNALGLTLDDLTGISPEQQFERITQGLGEMQDATERSARAQEIFGRHADTVLRLVDAGADEVARMREEQRQLGNTLNKETTQAAENFNDAITSMKQAVQGVVLTHVSDNMEDIAAAMEVIKTALPYFLKFVTGAIRLAGAAAELGGGLWASQIQAFQGNFGEAANAFTDSLSRFKDTASDVFGIQPKPPPMPDNLIQAEGGEGEAPRVEVDMERVVAEQQRTNYLLAAGLLSTAVAG